MRVWNPTIGAGATLSDVGFNASYSGNNHAPAVFYVKGAQCHQHRAGFAASLGRLDA